MSALLPGPAYRIVTARLVIRCYHPTDAPLLKVSIDENIEHLRPWMPWIAGEPTELQEKVNLLRMFRGSFDLGKDFTYAIFNPEESRLLGGCGLHTRLGEGAREIGYWIHKEFTGQGLATETSAALTKVAFEVDNVSRVEIHCDDRNTGSAAVPRKLGYTLEGSIPEPDHLDGSIMRNTLIWVLSAQQYSASPCAQIAIQAFDGADRRVL
jgi:RimJ/RimL family protein N-acetyltransferase